MSDMPGFFWIGELAALAGVSPRAIRHYHRVGVLPEPARSPSGYRLYDCDDVDRLLALRALADVEFRSRTRPIRAGTRKIACRSH